MGKLTRIDSEFYRISDAQAARLAGGLFRPLPLPVKGIPMDVSNPQPQPLPEPLPRVLEIEEVHPAEYASRRGDESADGCLFYNCSERVRPGRVTANPDWSADDWRTFAAAVRRQLAEVRDAIACLAEPDEKNMAWTGDDADGLEKLERWASDLAERGPQTFTAMDEGGRGIVRITEAQALACSGSGSQDANVAATMPSVAWLADADDIRRFLKGYGAWDAEELKDDAANRARALFLACIDVAENLADFAD